MCIQMTQATILNAKREEKNDGEFQTACSNVCSTGAMVFEMLMIKSKIVN
jgi:molybdopterin-containing oxidoreductase family iron-sulfur binding subunit